MNKQTNSFQIFIIINAILYLFSIPSDMPSVYENTFSMVNFLFTAILCIQLYRANIIGVALYFFIISVLYNPFLFWLHNMQTPSGADALVGVSFFMIALCWSFFVGTKK